MADKSEGRSVGIARNMHKLFGNFIKKFAEKSAILGNMKIGDIKNTEMQEAKKSTDKVEGFIFDIEGELLYTLAKRCVGKGVIVEIGSYKGKSTIYLGCGSKRGNNVKIYAVDPHANPEGKTNFEEFLNNVKNAKLDGIITPILKTSEEAVKNFHEPVELIFIDGSHEYDFVKKDFELWFPKVTDGGIMAFHDTLGTRKPDGAKKVVEESLYKSKNFRNVGFVASTTFGEKVRRNSMIERLRNRFSLLLKDLVTFLVIFARKFFGLSIEFGDL